MTIPLQTGTIYGPLKSRRFGSSLGINLLPFDQKVCNFNCVYCQYGESRLTSRAEFPSLQSIQDELKDSLAAIQDSSTPIDWITLAGNGEPTLHPDFPQLVELLISFRDQRLPSTPIGILSNASTCYIPKIQDALSRLDGRFMKLDAGGDRIFHAVNLPKGAVTWADIVAGLYHLKNIVLQSLFFTGDIQNISEDLVDEWISTIQYIQPSSVQIVTIDRPPRDEGLQPVSRERLDWISGRLFKKTGIQGQVYL